jgi:methylenetetrahydrofolate reductase (NADPH)
LPSGTADVGDFATRASSSSSSAGDRRLVPHRRRRVSGIPPAVALAGRRPRELQAQDRRGRQFAITQYFFNPDAYWRFVDACDRVGVDVPIVPGIMPISSYTSFARFSDACGAEIPRWIRRKLESFGDETASIARSALDVSRRCARRCSSAARRGCISTR